MCSFSFSFVGSFLLVTAIVVAIATAATTDQPCKADGDCTLLADSVCTSEGYCKCKAGLETVNAKCAWHECKADKDCDGFNKYDDRNYVCDTGAGHCICDLKNNELSKDGTECINKVFSQVWTVMIIIIILSLCCCFAGCVVIYCVCCGKKSKKAGVASSSKV